MVENIFWLSFDINKSAKYFFNKNHEINMQRGFKSKLIYHTVVRWMSILVIFGYLPTVMF